MQHKLVCGALLDQKCQETPVSSNPLQETYRRRPDRAHNDGTETALSLMY